jgi:hypothetical protein
MDAAAHYRHLLQLGREEFLAAAAPAALVRYHDGHSTSAPPIDQEGETIVETMPRPRDATPPGDPTGLELYPLSKKPGASFPDRITIGRTPNNDVVIAEPSVSRFHAYVRHDGPQWVVADAGSKNGSWLDKHRLEPRKERALASRSVLRLGDVDLTFVDAGDLFAELGGS